MTIANLGIVRVAATLKSEVGDDLVNVFDIRNDTGSAVDYAAAIAALAAAFDDLYTGFNSFIAAGVTYYSLNYWDVAGDAPMGLYGWPVLENGAGSEVPLPSQVAGFVFFRTHKARCIGKKFLPGPMENANESTGKPTGTYKAALKDFGDELWVPDGIFDTIDWHYVVHSSVDGLYYPPYQTVESPVWSTLRRRRPGRGS